MCKCENLRGKTRIITLKNAEKLFCNSRQYMHKTEIENKKEKLKLSKKQKEILIGLMLGDGHLETTNQEKTYRLKIEHSVKQKEYVVWKYQIFKEWVNTEPKLRIVKNMTNNKLYSKYYFNTLSSGKLRFFAHQFYQNKKKVVPKLIHRWLTPLALAVWFMDDGSKKSNKHKALILNTQSFNKIDLKRLQNALLKNFSLKTKLRKQKEGKQIYILSESADKFKSIVRPYIISSMNYKLN